MDRCAVPLFPPFGIERLQREAVKSGTALMRRRQGCGRKMISCLFACFFLFFFFCLLNFRVCVFFLFFFFFFVTQFSSLCIFLCDDVRERRWPGLS